MYAEHYPIVVGSVVRFVAMNGTVVNRTLTAALAIGDDIVVGVLDSDVPGSIGFAKLLPSSATSMLNERFPVMELDQEEKALVADFNGISGTLWTTSNPTSAPRTNFSETLTAGDSGNPGFVIIHGAPVIVTTWHYGGAFGAAGPALHLHISGINAAMTTLGGGYQVTTVDLSEFE